MIPRYAASDGGPTTADETEQNGKHQYIDVAYFYGMCLLQSLYCHLCQDSNHIVITVKHYMSQGSQLTTMIILYICFCTEVCVLVF